MRPNQRISRITGHLKVPSKPLFNVSPLHLCAANPTAATKGFQVKRGYIESEGEERRERGDGMVSMEGKDIFVRVSLSLWPAMWSQKRRGQEVT
jgi:hypothetical protein